MNAPQVEASHYFRRGYLYKERWVNYWYQIEAALTREPSRVLEIGVGNGIVTKTLEAFGVTVETVDIDPKLHPTHVASVTQLPVPDASYDFVLCAEVLEHLPYEESLRAMKELRRVTKRYALVTLPHAGYTFSFLSKLPLLPWLSGGFKLPHAWKTHRFNGQHYWELGKRGFSKRKIVDALRDSGFRSVKMSTHPDDPAHVFYLCEV
jgi:SAM-dependent methyltransferase